VTVFEEDLREYKVTSTNPYAAPRLQPYPVTLEEGQGNHIAVYQNFQAAILQEAPLEADGLQGSLELELANAITYSNYTHREVELPLDRQQYANLLAELSQS
jgi:hypothetical protein